MLRASLADLVPTAIQMLQQQGEAFGDRWWDCIRLTPLTLQSLAAAEGALASGGVRPGAEAQVLLAPAVLAFPLAALAFAPGGIHIGDLHWQATHPMADAAIPFRVTEDRAPGRAAWEKPLHRITVARLRLWVPLLMAANADLSQADMQAEILEVGALSPESALFSEALVVGGTPKQMGEAFVQLARALAVMAFAPGGITMMNHLWEARARHAPWATETPVSGEEIRP
jgi:hypothetical protein